jgi:NAD(P)-dependent dehydrogenase (short-subunit alcohol dehydrogenase family)
MPVAVITGASRGLGLAIARALVQRGWRLIVDARDGAALQRATEDLGVGGQVTAIPGDVSDAAHRGVLAAAIEEIGPLSLLVNNASVLGPSPQPALEHYPIGELERVIRVNAIAPMALIQLLLPALRAAEGTIINVTSDAAVEAYEGWGGYGASKAALDQLTAILGEEQRSLHVYSFDPGDMRTAMQKEAFPTEDISDRPEPESVLPFLLRLIDERPPSGRYTRAGLTRVSEGVST